jgi:hypothetical protein
MLLLYLITPVISCWLLVTIIIFLPPLPPSNDEWFSFQDPNTPHIGPITTRCPLCTQNVFRANHPKDVGSLTIWPAQYQFYSAQIKEPNLHPSRRAMTSDHWRHTALFKESLNTVCSGRCQISADYPKKGPKTKDFNSSWYASSNILSLKGQANEILISFFWHILMGLGLNMNCF